MPEMLSMGLVRLVMMSLVLPVLLVHQAAAQGLLSVDSVLQLLHADEVIYDVDTAQGVVHGIGRQADRRDLPSIEFVCDSRSLLLRYRATQSQDLYPAPVGLCDALASALRQTNKSPGQ